MLGEQWERRGFHRDSEGNLLYTSMQETDAIERHCADLRAEGLSANQSPDKAFRRVAVLPLQIIEEIRIKTGINCMDGTPDAKDMLHRILKSGDYAKFLTAPL